MALLSTAFALPYALVQPVLGALADTFGKARLMNVAIGASALAGAIGAIAPNFSVLLASRILAGRRGRHFPDRARACGRSCADREETGGDRPAACRRHVRQSPRLPFAGLVGDIIGWRGVFALVTAAALIAFVAV